ncbi:Embryo defective protein [Quillaja saponaria]|uniref:Embryo defective protein n=1 Tax=Quillaja saponaria TaxID=32244 RepID=A0AAD7LXE0_QUISA|nr:Embryo defective protein [Quillaja saponaria]
MERGLDFVRGFIFVTVISGICLLAWYGQNKAKGFIEAKLLPSVCLAVSEHIQRDLDFGKVRRISPLSITLESCSFGPYTEEFSCGEVPTVKLRLSPFESLRRGKIVIDAVLSHPTVLVVQKKDYSWLGIPSSEGVIQRHLSSEKGIDYRTKTRRIAREEAAAKRERERDDAARQAAELGYIVSEKSSSLYEDDALKNITTHSTEPTNSKFGEIIWAKFHGSGSKFWSKMIKGPKKHKFKRKATESDISTSGLSVKRRILKHSALAAHTYFHGLSHGKFGELSFPSGGFDAMNVDKLSVKSEVDNIADFFINGGEHRINENQNKKNYRDPGTENSIVQENGKGNSNYSNFRESPFLLTRGKQNGDNKFDESLSPAGNVAGPVNDDRNVGEMFAYHLGGPIKCLKSELGPKVEDIVSELVDGVDVVQSEGIEKMLPVTLDSVHFRGATLILLAYGNREVREMGNVNGHVKFQNHYGRVHVQLSGNCKTWRSDMISEDGGWLSADVFVDNIEQKWHANLKIGNLFVPLFERILKIPFSWSEGRASGEVHLCMSRGETFPNLHGRLDMRGLNFQLLDAPSWFSLDAIGRPDESLAVEFVGPLQPGGEDSSQSGKLLSFSLQKGQLRADICFQPFHSANLRYAIFHWMNWSWLHFEGPYKGMHLDHNGVGHKGETEGSVPVFLSLLPCI